MRRPHIRRQRRRVDRTAPAIDWDGLLDDLARIGGANRWLAEQVFDSLRQIGYSPPAIPPEYGRKGDAA